MRAAIARRSRLRYPGFRSAPSGLRGILVGGFAIIAFAATAQDAEFRILDLTFQVRDLQFRALDLDLPDRVVAGAPTDLAVAETETEIRISLAADVLFDFDSSDIRDEAAAALSKVATVIREHPNQPVRIEGHTDSKGADAYNQALSEDRALAVKEWLGEEAGIDGAAFEIVGFGESRPAAPNERPDGSDDPEGRQKNRRVEIVIGK
jgi:outer membrane protein OmpA-like peptidoglycan-associated protein